jgi:hypothetical protein
MFLTSCYGQPLPEFVGGWSEFNDVLPLPHEEEACPIPFESVLIDLEPPG